MRGGNRGGSIGPYASGKIYCAFCGEFRRYGVDVATHSHNGKLVCIECDRETRTRGRHWIKTIEPKRY